MLGETPIFEKKNVIVTGGAGFIGSHLCEKLLQEAKVICIDDLSNSNIQSIDHLLQYPDFEFIKYDVNKPIDLEEFGELEKFKVKFQGVQEIYHLACPTSPRNFENLKLKSLWANSNAMISTLDLAVRYKAKYLFASSSVVYGEPTPENKVFSESDEGIVQHLSPRGCYDEGKRFAETCVETYRQVYGIDAKIARVFTTYGPRMKLHDALLIPDFILNAIEGKDLVIYGDGGMELSFCYITDMIEGIYKLMISNINEPVNLGNPEEHTIIEFANLIKEITRSKSKIAFKGLPVDDPHVRCPDINKAKKELGWELKVNLREGLQKTIEWFKKN